MTETVEDERNKRMRYDERIKIKGKVLLTKKKILDLNDVSASIIDRFDEIRGHKVSLQLISSTSVNADPNEEELRGIVGKAANLENWVTTITPLTADHATFGVTFEWDKEIGVPGAFLITNHHHHEFYLKTLTLEAVPGHGRLHFVCNSWIYPTNYYNNKDRIFFTNQTYLPSETPKALNHYRQEELANLRGTGDGKLEEWDRVYDYDVYNDLGDTKQDKDSDYVRPILGGSEYPYPRRGRTGRPPLDSDPKRESRLPLYDSLKIYVPRDEKFSQMKMTDFAAYAVKSIFQFLVPEIHDLFDKTHGEFDKMDDVLELYKGKFNISKNNLLKRIRDHIPSDLIKELLRTDGEAMGNLPVPQVIKENESAWSSDEEFAREMLAGINPLVIRRLQEFPPKSNLDQELYGNQHSKITKEHIISYLDGLSLTVEEAMKKNRLYILDHHDALMPYLRQINKSATKIYSTRTILLLENNGRLKPLAIELSLPHENESKVGAISIVCTPAEEGTEKTIWQLAKAYVSVNDSGYHQLICHWLNTHAAIEPFIIATNRQLSVLHPIHKLLQPHFRDTMHINALGRQTLINADGLLEMTVFPTKYAMEFSAAAYKNWVFPEQALPADLIKRGMAVEDSNSPHGLKLLIEDYPYAVDGLEIWSAIKTWVSDYCSVYYKTDESIQKDPELQSWWKEVIEKGHADKKTEPWWPKMKNQIDLIESCTTIIWVASALHAAINFGQYPYGGYPPNRPAMSRQHLPEPETDEFGQLKSDPEKAYLRTITSQRQSILGISLIEILSRHSSDEVFLGQRDTLEWTTDIEAIKAFGRFGKKLEEIEKKIEEMNVDKSKWRNRVGPVNMPYTLLYPSSQKGLTGKGIPNSVSI
jgi:linoleate 9S-lipoxygenase